MNIIRATVLLFITKNSTTFGFSLSDKFQEGVLLANVTS